MYIALVLLLRDMPFIEDISPLDQTDCDMEDVSLSLPTSLHPSRHLTADAVFASTPIRDVYSRLRHS